MQFGIAWFGWINVNEKEKGQVVPFCLLFFYPFRGAGALAPAPDTKFGFVNEWLRTNRSA